MPEPVCDPPQPSSDDQQDPSRSLLRSEDWWSVWLGSILIIAVILKIIPSIPKLGTWTVNPLSALAGPALCGELLLVVGMAALTAVGMKVMGRSVSSYLKGFAVVVAIALLAKLIGRQESLKAYGLGYALWALVFGLLISNIFGTPGWLLGGVRSELFIKIGLVLLGAEILASKIIELGAPGLLVAWLVTPGGTS